MRITHSIIASIAKVRGLQLRTFQVVPQLRDGLPARYWHTTDGLHYQCYKLSLEPTESNIYISHEQVHPAQSPLRQLPPGIWSFVECEGAIVQAGTALTDGDVVYLGDEEHYRVTIALDAELIPN
jgi:hypothetical protein